MHKQQLLQRSITLKCSFTSELRQLLRIFDKIQQYSLTITIYRSIQTPMDGLSNVKVKSDVRRMLDMQSLLEEYDRENRYLNKQVLQLLAQNKALKIDKVQQKSSKLLTQSRERQSLARGRGNRGNQNDIVTKWKREIEKTSNKVNKEIEKKEEGVQVELAIKVSPPKNKNQETENHKQIGSQVFSFGENTSRNNRKGPRAHSPSQVAVMNQSSVKVGSTGEKEGIIEESRDKIFIMDVVGIESSQQFRTEERERFKTQQKEIKESRFRQSEKSNEQKRKRGRSSHAIDPSPRILPSSSEKKLQTSIYGSQQKTFIKLVAHQSIQRFSSVEKKRFIDVVSKGQSMIRGKFISQPEGCC